MDDLSQKLLIDLSQDVGGQDREFIGALRVVQAAEDVFEGFVVNGEIQRERVGRGGPVFFGAKA
jgi:hypothetical protein